MRRKLKIIDAADYPTDLVQPLFEILRSHREFRAAWIFRDAREEGEKADYQVLVYMDPRDAVIFHDLNMPLSAAEGEWKVGLAFAPEEDAGSIARLFQAAPPFFVAADFGGPVPK